MPGDQDEMVAACLRAAVSGSRRLHAPWLAASTAEIRTPT
jgi:hypothetical protein